jgi:hypothetical protein
MFPRFLDEKGIHRSKKRNYAMQTRKKRTYTVIPKQQQEVWMRNPIAYLNERGQNLQ